MQIKISRANTQDRPVSLRIKSGSFNLLVIPPLMWFHLNNRLYTKDGELNIISKVETRS